MTKTSNVVPVTVKTEPEAGRDPLRIIIEIAENDKLSDRDKQNLILYARQRFKNRKRMAYISLSALVTSLGLLFLAAFIDGLSTCPEGQICTGILQSIKNSQTLFVWLEGFLTAVVAAYYGVSAWRPAG